MAKIKKLSLVIISLILVIGCVSCNANATWILKTKDEEVPVGLYICTLADANAEAEEKVNEQITPAEEDTTEAVSDAEAETTTEAQAETTTEKINYSKHKIDGTDFNEWVKNRAVELTKEIVAAEKKAKDLEIELGPEVDDSLESYWEYYGDFYTKLGVSQSSFNRYFRGNYLKEEIKHAYYGKDGEAEISKKELKKALKENYISVYSLQLSKSTPVTDEEGNTTYGTYDEKILKKLRKIMDGYADALQNGAVKDYDKIEKKFQDETNEICGIEPTDDTSSESNEASATIEGDADSDTKSSKLKETDNIQIYNNNGEDNDELTQNLVDAKMGKAGWFETDGVFVVYLKTNDIMDNPYYLDNYTNDLIDLLKKDEFNDVLEDWAKELGAKVNSNATKAYTFKLYEKAEKENSNS